MSKNWWWDRIDKIYDAFLTGQITREEMEKQRELEKTLYLADRKRTEEWNRYVHWKKDAES